MTRTADAVNIERKAILMETPSWHIVDSLTNLVRPYLRDLSAHGAYLVTVAIVIVTGLIFRGRLETVTHHKPQLYQQTQRIVKRSAADREIIVVGQLVAQFLQREMPVHAIYCIKDSKALRSLSMFVQFQISGQDVLDRCLDILSHFMWS